MAEFREAVCEARCDFFRAVAIAAEVAEDDLEELGVGDFSQQRLDLDVGKVAVAGGNALLDRPGALGVEFKQFVIVVRLDEKGG